MTNALSSNVEERSFQDEFVDLVLGIARRRFVVFELFPIQAIIDLLLEEYGPLDEEEDSPTLFADDVEYILDFAATRGYLCWVANEDLPYQYLYYFTPPSWATNPFEDCE